MSNTRAHSSANDRAAIWEEDEEEENLFAKKAGCQKGLQPINAVYRKHKHYTLNNSSMSSV